MEAANMSTSFTKNILETLKRLANRVFVFPKSSVTPRKVILHSLKFQFLSFFLPNTTHILFLSDLGERSYFNSFEFKGAQSGS